MDPCGPLTDKQYLQHMIPHHQVALDMSRKLLETSQWPELLAIARHIVWVQDMEIKLMGVIVQREMESVSSTDRQQMLYIPTQGDWTHPNTRVISDTACDPSFFHGHGHEMEITDDAYIAHMIPHHQVAVDMSKRLLLVTTNDYMIDLAYSIIRSQQAEIARLAALATTDRRKVFASTLLN